MKILFSIDIKNESLFTSALKDIIEQYENEKYKLIRKYNSKDTIYVLFSENYEITIEKIYFNKNLNLANIIEICSKATGITMQELYSPSRLRSIVQARMFYFKYAREYSVLPYSVIGKTLNRDHTTVLYGIRKINNLLSLKHEKYLRNINETIENMLNELIISNTKHYDKS